MNPHILKLAQKAKVIQEDECIDYEDYTHIKQFAELLVWECAMVSENYKGFTDKYFISDAIKKHFGLM